MGIAWVHHKRLSSNLMYYCNGAGRNTRILTCTAALLAQLEVKLLPGVLPVVLKGLQSGYNDN